MQPASLWRPSPERIDQSAIYRYMQWLGSERGLSFADYQSLYEWSIQDLDAFWSSIWDHFGVIAHHPYSEVLSTHRMPGARWFDGATLNYAEHALRAPAEKLAIIGRSEQRAEERLTYGQLRDEVAAVAAGLRELGVGLGDRVAAFMPNTPEAAICLLATSSIGAVWSSCPPEFGLGSVIDRFAQIAPKVLIAADGYIHSGKAYDRTLAVGEIRANSTAATPERSARNPAPRRRARSKGPAITAPARS